MTLTAAIRILGLVGIAATAYAQAGHRGGGGGASPGRPPGSITSTGFAGALGNSVQGTLGNGVNGPLLLGGFGGGYFNNAPAYLSPVAPTVYTTGPGYAGPWLEPSYVSAPAPSTSSITVYEPTFRPQIEEAPQPPPVPPAVARKNTENLHALAAVLHVDTPDASASQPTPQPARSFAPLPLEEERIILIELRDKNVVTAIAYWTDQGILHYVTPAHEQKQVPVANVKLVTDSKLRLR